MPRKKKKKEDEIRILDVPPNATLRQIYDRMRETFTAADLQKFTELPEPGVPIEEVIAQMEAIHEKEARKRRRKA
jgi:hypothetical protein